MDTAILTEKEAAKRLFARPDTLRKWRTRGRGPTYLKLSGKIRYRADDLEKFIEQSRVVPSERKRRRRKALSPKQLKPATSRRLLKA
jgi:predicted site-specific integrase-resolvase